MHRPARRPSPRKFLGWGLQKKTSHKRSSHKKKTPALFRIGGRPVSKSCAYLLVEQVLEIIFTLFTVNVDWVPVAPAPALLLEVLEPGLVELGLLELGLEELGLLEPEADELLSDPMRRT